MSNLPPGTGSLPGEDDNNGFEWLDRELFWSMFTEFENSYSNLEDLLEMVENLEVEDDKHKLIFAKEFISFVKNYFEWKREVAKNW
jgi:hypothetical protein